MIEGLGHPLSAEYLDRDVFRDSLGLQKTEGTERDAPWVLTTAQVLQWLRYDKRGNRDYKSSKTVDLLFNAEGVERSREELEMAIKQTWLGGDIPIEFTVAGKQKRLHLQ